MENFKNIRTLQNNQIIIEDNKYIEFYSYNTLIARIDRKTGNLFFSSKYDYSKTTSKYLYIFIDDYKDILNYDIYKIIIKSNYIINKKFINELINNQLVKIEY